MAREPTPALAGLRVLVTRPRHQSVDLEARIEALGGTAIAFPVIDILPVRDSRAARDIMSKLDEFSLVIFVSPNAVEQALALVDSAPLEARVAAVGESSAAALERAGFHPVLRPSRGASSEALLALPELSAGAIAGTRVLIVRGEGGRQLLGCTLSKRGARVTYAEVYRRAKPDVDAHGIVAQGQDAGIDVIVVTSVQGLDNLFEMLGEGGRGWLERAGYVVISERVAAHAHELGVRDEPMVAARADDDAFIDALIEWRAARLHDRK